MSLSAIEQCNGVGVKILVHILVHTVFKLTLIMIVREKVFPRKGHAQKIENVPFHGLSGKGIGKRYTTLSK